MIKKKKILLIIIPILVLVIIGFLTPDGRCGDNANWHYNRITHTLTISGTGETEYYDNDARGIEFFGPLVDELIARSSRVPWYRYLDKITNIKIKEGITCIDGDICESIENVSIPSTVTKIGETAFEQPHNFKVSKNNPNYATIGGSLYNKDMTKLINAGQPSLTEYTVSENVTTIGEYAFRNRDDLTKIVLHNSIKKIEESAFYNCKNLKTIIMPDSMTYIGNKAFQNCSSLKEITIPDGVTIIGDWAFAGCSSLAEITIPDSVTSIGEWAFSGCSSLTSITIPDSVTSIGYSAFENCSSLASITIPNGVTSIGTYAFENCSSLIIHSYSNSTTENYAKDNNIPFVVIS